MQTPIEKLLNALDKAIKSMPDIDQNIVKTTTIACRELAQVFLYDEEIAIKNAFTDGEQNVWNRDRDGHIFEYANGQDYFNKNYKTK